MKPQKIILVGLLLLVSAATLSAQSALPNPHDDSCWSSLSSLRACELQAYDRAVDYAQRCTSYPEYQCAPVDEPAQPKLLGKHSAKYVSPTATNVQATSSSSAPAAADTSAPSGNTK